MRHPLLALLAAAACLAAPAQAATFITSSQTLAGNYSGSFVLVGLTPAMQRVNDLQVSITPGARFDYSDQTGGGLQLYANTRATVLGGSFSQTSPTGCCGGVLVRDTAELWLSGGQLDALHLQGSAAGAAGARAHMTGGAVENWRSIVSNVIQGELNISGGSLSATSGQPALVGDLGAVIHLSGGSVSSVRGSGAYISSDARFTMTGGSVAGWAPSALGVHLNANSEVAMLSAGSVAGGLRAERYSPGAGTAQAELSGSVNISGGVVTLGHGSLRVAGGSYQPLAGTGAHFLALGAGDLEIWGDGLALSAPTAGSVFLDNAFSGNFHTFTAGTLRDGQSAVGLTVFDALTIGASMAGMGGGIRLVSAVPEPAGAALLLLGLPLLARAQRRRSGH